MVRIPSIGESYPAEIALTERRLEAPHRGKGLFTPTGGNDTAPPDRGIARFQRD